ELRTRSVDGYLNTLALSPDGKILAKDDEDKMIHFWDSATGKEFRRWAQHAHAIEQMRFAPGGRFLATAPSHESPIVRLWDIPAGRQWRSLGEKAQGSIGLTPIAFSPDGFTVVSEGEDGAVYLWEAATGRERQHISVTSGKIVGLAFSPDGKVLAIANRDGTTQFWSLSAGKKLADLRAGSLPYVAKEPIAFSRDGRMLATMARDTTVLIWDLRGFGLGERPPARDLQPTVLRARWTDLASDDAKK